MSYRNNDCRIYVGNLPPDIRTKDIEDLFYKFGKITFIDLKNRRGPPFAFVEFEDPRDAEDAVQARDGYDYDGYRLRVEFPRGNGPGRGMGTPRGRGRGPPARRSQYRVLVSGLPSTGSWQDLKDHMREAGDVCYADVHKDGTGVVEFLRYEDMKYAVKKLDDSRFRSHEISNRLCNRKSKIVTPLKQAVENYCRRARHYKLDPEWGRTYRIPDEDEKIVEGILNLIQGEVAYIRVKEDYGSRSRSRSYSPRRTRGSPTYSPARSITRSRSPS